MSTDYEGGLVRQINLLVQTLAILVAGAWAAWVFHFQEILKPAAAPVNLSTQLDVSQVGTRTDSASGERLLAIELKITASNPSTRTIYILDNFWIARGVDIGPLPSDADWIGYANAETDDRNANFVGRHYAMTDTQAVAFGSIAPDESLKPNESVTHSYVFYVPEDAYDLLEIEALLPTITRRGAFEMAWSLNAEGVVSPAVHRIGEDGGREEVQPGPDGAYPGGAAVDLQTSASRRQVALWSSTPASSAEAVDHAGH